MKNNPWSDIAGWYGTVAIILAYALNSAGYIQSTSTTYQLLNLSGAIGMIMMGLLKRVYQPAVLNTVWAAIAIFALIQNT